MNASVCSAIRNVLLVIVVGIPSVLFLTLITHGVIWDLVLVAILLGPIALAHYLVWGRQLSRQAKADRRNSP